MTSELRPKTCPRCGREAWFRYANATEAAKRAPICWGDLEQYCPGYPEYAREQAAKGHVMHVFTNGTDTVVAADLADAQRVVEAHYGSTFEQEGWSLDDWEEVLSAAPIVIVDDSSNRVVRTAREWAVSHGRGFLCSTEY